MTDEFDQTLKRALRVLARRDLFEAELRTRLEGEPPDAIERVVAHLRSKGILNDVRCAEQAVLRRSGRRAVATRALQDELCSRGAPDSAVRLVSAGLRDEDAARAILETSFRPTPSERPRAGRTLARRGFGHEEIESALNRYFGTDD